MQTGIKAVDTILNQKANWESGVSDKGQAQADCLRRPVHVGRTLAARCRCCCATLPDGMGAGSMTGLSIIETKPGDVSAYIPANVISVTDGQIYRQVDLLNDHHDPQGCRLPPHDREQLTIVIRMRLIGNSHTG